jgi:hypothetical protein
MASISLRRMPLATANLIMDEIKGLRLEFAASINRKIRHFSIVALVFDLALPT